MRQVWNLVKLLKELQLEYEGIALKYFEREENFNDFFNSID